jgi:hypothetical protein
MMQEIRTIEKAGIVWDVLHLQGRGFDMPHKKHGAQLRDYCCDGDGMVVVREYEDGVFRVLDQGDYRGDYSSFDDAITKAVKVLKKDYYAIYEMYFEGETA